MALSTDPQVWIASFIVIAYNSFIWRDNIFFRIALSTVLAANAGYFMTTSLDVINKNSLQLLLQPTPDLVQIVVLIFGIVALLRLSETWGWLSRYPTAFLIGIGIALTGGPMVHMVKDLLLGKLVPFETGFSGKALWVIFVLITGMTYFVISRIEPKGAAGGAWKTIVTIGRYFVMFGLGLIAADTIAGFFEYVYFGYEKVLWELLGLGGW